MNARGAPLPHAGGGRDVLVVVTEDGELPAWVVGWCRMGRRLRHVCAVGPFSRIEIVTAFAGTSVLLVGGALAASPRPPRVVAAVRDLPDDDAVLIEAATAAERLGAELVLAHVVPVSFAERSVGMAEALENGRRVLENGVERLACAVPPLVVVPRLLRRRPHELVGEELNADLLVLGGPRPSLPGRLGLVANSAIQHAHCQILLVPRPAERAVRAASGPSAATDSSVRAFSAR
ncbi:MAG TPA: universal stress protein [Pseudonocardia sp.]